MKRPGKQDRPTVEKILDAASPLFYRRGLVAVTLDEIAASAKMTKRTLYYHFPTKDDLILAYLQRWRSRTQQTFAEDADRPGLATLLSAFRNLEQEVSRPEFRGCPFVNAVAELNDRAHPAIALAVSYKEERRAWFERLLRKDGIAGASKLSEQVMALWEGAVVRALVNGDAKAVRAAHDAVGALICPKGSVEKGRGRA
jgi:AcrR family transcriptional regulator